MADKDYSEMVSMISSVAAEVFTLTPDNPRSLSADKLADIYNLSGVKATASSSVSEAVSKAVASAKESQLPIFALGSLYMYLEVKNAVIKAK